MGIEENKALIRRFYKFYSQQELDACDEILSDSCFNENFTREYNRQLDIILFKACPDLKATILEMVAEGDKVGYIRVLSGTHTGEPFMGIPATGKNIETRAGMFAKIADNKVMGGSIFSEPTLWQSFGVKPPWEETV